MKKKCVLILPYFGQFNNYFPLFLNSCAANPSYDWFIITDNTFNYDYPLNVHVIRSTLEDVRKKACDIFGFEVALKTPYKLCDYKPAYGFLFEDYIQNYDYWGHCDCDLIFGNLEKFLSPLFEKDYDKLFAAGHLTIYKNTPLNNRRFMKDYAGRSLYKEAYTTDKIYVFDEDCIGENNPKLLNVHAIFLDQKAKIYKQDLSMNVSTRFGKFVNERYDYNTRRFVCEQYIPRRYYWKDGNVLSFEWIKKENRICVAEYLYIHLQMRKMRVKFNMDSINNIEILPDRFIKRMRTPSNKDELRIKTIGFTYLYEWDKFSKRLQRKLEKVIK